MGKDKRGITHVTQTNTINIYRKKRARRNMEENRPSSRFIFCACEPTVRTMLSYVKIYYQWEKITEHI